MGWAGSGRPIYCLPRLPNYFTIPDQFGLILNVGDAFQSRRRAMDKQQLIEKATDTLRPFETHNLIEAAQQLTVKQVFTHPAVLFLLVVVFFFGVIKRSKTVLLSLFSLFSLAVIMRYAMPVPGDDLSMTSMLPFIGGGLLVGCVVIYFSLIKSD
jgi:hypothetical protein